MLTVTSSNDESSNCLKLLGLTSPREEGGLISNTTSLLSTPNGNGMDSCSFYLGPSDATIFAFGESGESCGSIAFGGSDESCGSIAFSGGGESCGSIASSGGSSGFSGGGGCSYSC